MNKETFTDAEKLFEMGKRYHKGEGIPKDLTEAEKWYTKAAEQGHADAQTELGHFFIRGGTNFRVAADWYEKAAEQGHAEAAFSLGMLYKSGYRVNRNSFEDIHYPPTDIQRNLDLAIKWLQKAVEQGDVEAKKLLAFW